MANVAAVPHWDKSSLSLPPQICREIESWALCPWCDGAMHLNRTNDRLLCADLIHCAGVTPVDAQLVEACTRLAMTKEVA